jgi:hypothetical protein
MQSADDQLSAGLTKHGATLAPFVVAGQTYKPADVITTLQTRKNTATNVATTRSSWRAAVAADRNERAQTAPLIAGVKQSLQVTYAGSVDTLADFGLEPRKKAVVSPETRVASAAKAKATRTARRTMGSVQKKAVKGDVANVTVTPLISPPPQPAATSSPSPAATSSPSPAATSSPSPTATSSSATTTGAAAHS